MLQKWTTPLFEDHPIIISASRKLRFLKRGDATFPKPKNLQAENEKTELSSLEASNKIYERKFEVFSCALLTRHDTC